MLSADKKKEIYTKIPKEFTIRDVVFRPTTIYSNQFAEESINNCCCVTLEYDDEDVVVFEPLTGYRELKKTNGDIARKRGRELDATLTLDVYAYDYSKDNNYIPGAIIANDIANSLRHWFAYDFKVEDVLVMRVTGIRNLDDLIATKYRYRREFSVTLRYVEEVVEVVPPIERVEAEIERIYP